MAQVTYYLESKLLNHFLGKATFLPSGKYYLGLGTGDSGATFSEVTAPEYKRQEFKKWVPITFPDTFTHTNALKFPAALGSWGTVTLLGLFDERSGGNLLFFMDLAASIVITQWDAVVVKPKTIVVMCNGYPAVEVRTLEFLFNPARYDTAPLSLALLPEPDASTGYQRVELASGAWNDPVEVSGAAKSTNNGLVQFPVATASWGSVMPAVVDSQIRLTFNGISYPGPVAINAGDQPYMDANSITLKIV